MTNFSPFEITIGIISALVLIGWLLYHLINAPLGYEDENRFHEDKK